jgi:hypothetical protein
MRWATFFRLALSFDVSTRICERLFVHFVLPGTVWRDLLRTLCGKYPTIHRSAQRGEQKCVPVQGRCDILPPVRTGSYALGLCARRLQRALPPQGTTTRDSRPARFVALAIDRFRALPAMRAQLAFGFAGVCEMYEGHKHLCRLRRRRPPALCLPCVESAMCSRAGPVGVSCPGRLSPPFRDSGSASPSCALLAPRSGRGLIIKKPIDCSDPAGGFVTDV